MSMMRDQTSVPAVGRRQLRGMILGTLGITLTIVALLSAASRAHATNRNFCDRYWSYFDTRCWASSSNQNGGPPGNPTEWASFERGINYTRYYDMWVFDYTYGAVRYSTHAGKSTYKACIGWGSRQYNDFWAIMPFYPTRATIGGHIDNYLVSESC